MRVADILNTEKRKSYAGWGARPETYFETTVEGPNVVLATSSTRAKAEEKALEALKEQFKNISQRAYFCSPSGRTTFVVYFDQGWAYDTVRDGKSRGSAGCGGTFEECCGYAKRHAADYEECD